jgi:hypothetical protein
MILDVIRKMDVQRHGPPKFAPEAVAGDGEGPDVVEAALVIPSIHG